MSINISEAVKGVAKTIAITGPVIVPTPVLAVPALVVAVTAATVGYTVSKAIDWLFD